MVRRPFLSMCKAWILPPEEWFMCRGPLAARWEAYGPWACSQQEPVYAPSAVLSQRSYMPRRPSRRRVLPIHRPFSSRISLHGLCAVSLRRMIHGLAPYPPAKDLSCSAGLSVWKDGLWSWAAFLRRLLNGPWASYRPGKTYVP